MVNLGAQNAEQVQLFLNFEMSFIIIITLHIFYTYLYLYKYENVCLCVCLCIRVFLGYLETDWDILWHKATL